VDPSGTDLGQSEIYGASEQIIEAPVGDADPLLERDPGPPVDGLLVEQQRLQEETPTGRSEGPVPKVNGTLAAFTRVRRRHM